jgi:carboxymethylenebutenolidase
VLKGEGTHPILFGSTSIVAGPRTLRGYLARPDLSGEWPTVILVPSEWGITSSSKDICRRLARLGLAVVAVDLYRGRGPSRGATADEAAAAAAAIPSARAQADLDGIVGFITNPAGFWSNAEGGFGVMGIGRGGVPATGAAIRHQSAALALVAAPLLDDEGVGIVDSFGELASPLLGLYGKAENAVSIADIMEARAAAPQGEWVLYDNAGDGFMDDYLPDFDVAAYRDAIDRLATFFVNQLPAAG